MLQRTSTWRVVDIARDVTRVTSIKVLSLVRGTAPILYHIGLVMFSAAIALSLPFAVTLFAQYFLAYWAEIEHEKAFLVAAEIAVALVLVSFFNFVGRSLKDNRLADMARWAGLMYFFPSRGRFVQRKVRKLKKKHGLVRSVMIIGSTGYRTFVDPKGELRPVLENCLEAKIMLLNPDSAGAKMRAKAIAHPHVTHGSMREQVCKSVDLLKQLKSAQKNIKLKLYADPPHLKLAILGDSMWIQHYHTNLDVQTMPEYVFKHNQNDHGLYTLFYQYFMRRWESPEIPEYDLDTDEIVFGSGEGGVVKRVKLYLVDEGERLIQKDSQ